MFGVPNVTGILRIEMGRTALRYGLGMAKCLTTEKLAGEQAGPAMEVGGMHVGLCRKHYHGWGDIKSVESQQSLVPELLVDAGLRDEFEMQQSE